jgi:hypothetical protein
MATLEWKFKSAGSQDDLITTAEYRRDWQDWKDGRGYFGRALVPYKRGISLLVDVHIFGKANRRDVRPETIQPPQGNWTLKFSFGKAAFVDGSMMMQIQVQQCIQLADGQPKRYLREDLHRAFADNDSTYRLVVAVQLKGEEIRRPADSWQRGEPGTYSGGLPESNRRRH